jgi:DNA transformation protein and related proteins
MEQKAMRLRNIGPETEKWLGKIGIETKQAFERLGAEKTYKLLLEAGHEPNSNLFYALKGAELDMDWRIVAERERMRAKSRFADVDEP